MKMKEEIGSEGGFVCPRCPLRSPNVQMSLFCRILLMGQIQDSIDHWQIQRGAGDAQPSSGPNSFIFMQFSAKI